MKIETRLPLTHFLTLLRTFITLFADTGAEQLKSKLAQLGLKCGGTVKQRAERLYAIKGKRCVAALFVECVGMMGVGGLRPSRLTLVLLA